MPEHIPLPVAGYTSQNEHRVAIVNGNKELEERVLRRIDELFAAQTPCWTGSNEDPPTWGPTYDPRWLALARTHIEQGFMAMNRAVFRPTRIPLPEDGQ